MNFYHTPPTQPGAYWFKPRPDSIPRPIEVTDLHGDGILGTFYAVHEQTLAELGGMFSDILEPREETLAEKTVIATECYKEGYLDGRKAVLEGDDDDDHDPAFERSDAKLAIDRKFQ